MRPQPIVVPPGYTHASAAASARDLREAFARHGAAESAKWHSPNPTMAATLNVPDYPSLVSELARQLTTLEQRIAALEASLEIVEELEWDEALSRARVFFDDNAGTKVYPDELAGRIGTSISQAVEICDALEREGAVVGE